MARLAPRSWHSSAPACACLCLLVAGCGGVKIRDATYSERCAAVLQQALPATAIDIKSHTADADLSEDLTTFVAKASGSSKENGRTYALDCVFHDGVLTAIRWTEGPEAVQTGGGYK